MGTNGYRPDELTEDYLDNVSVTDEATRLAHTALEMLAINLDHFNDEAGRNAAYDDADLDRGTWHHAVAHTGARLAAALLLHTYAEAESFGIELTHPRDLVTRYESLIDR